MKILDPKQDGPRSCALWVQFLITAHGWQITMVHKDLDELPNTCSLCMFLERMDHLKTGLERSMWRADGGVAVCTRVSLDPFPLAALSRY